MEDIMKTKIAGDGAACQAFACFRRGVAAALMAVIFAGLAFPGKPAFAVSDISARKVRIVTTTEDLAAIAREVGGDRVEVTAIARGYQDPHFVDPKPSYIRAMQQADMYIEVGLELEAGWASLLLDSARNAKIRPGGVGYLDASANCEIMEKPTGEVSRAQGDVHPFGNPHYWLDPGNGIAIANAVAEKLGELDPESASAYDANAKDFAKRVKDAELRWDRAMAPYKGTKIVTYHRSWPNFAKRFGLEVVNYVEPKPGIPPSPAHIVALIRQMKEQNVKLILMEPYFSPAIPQRAARQAGAVVLQISPSVGGDKNVKSYIDLFDSNIKMLTAALANAVGTAR